MKILNKYKTSNEFVHDCNILSFINLNMETCEILAINKLLTYVDKD